LATKNFVWLLSIFWLFLAAFLLNTEISNFSKIVCHPSVKVSYKLCYVRLHYPFHDIYPGFQRRLDSRPQSIMGIERLIPRVASLTVDCRGVNISLTMESFERQECQILCENSILLYCCDPHYDLCFTIPSLHYIKLHGTCCHFSLINNPSERRNCV
jgi:hypothetical protein